MKKQAVTRELLPKVSAAMARHALFQGLDSGLLGGLAQAGELVHYSGNETIARQGAAAGSFGVVLNGRVREYVHAEGLERPIEVRRDLGAETFGMVECFLGAPMRGTVMAVEQVLALEVPGARVQLLFEQMPAFAVQLVKLFAQRVADAEPTFPMPKHDVAKMGAPPKETMDLLPPQFIQRHRVLPMRQQGNQLTIGFVDDLTPRVMRQVSNRCPAHEVQPCKISGADFNRIMEGRGGSFEMNPVGGAIDSASIAALSTPAPALTAPHSPMSTQPIASGGGHIVVRRHGPFRNNNPKLDALLKRMVAEGASDLHLSALHKPRWRIDGEIREIAEARELGEETVLELFEPIMTDRQLAEFLGSVDGKDVDFAYALSGVARFRVNLFADRLGIGGVLRQIPDKILTFEQLGLPSAVAKLCDQPKGMVLVTGPTGSGKSTTLAAMIDYINKGKRTHILTMEDPIEFVHKSRKSLINQREMGVHSKGFQRALRAALRQDPDIVLIGELRDIETVSMAVETANTGHLVFGTLHTATAVSTVERIVDLFPPEQQAAVRAGVAEALKGVVAQTLLRKKGGGRIAALEIMIGSQAISNMIREGKMHQIPNIMLTAKKQGNQMLNEELEKLVRGGKVAYEEGLSKSLEKPDFAKRFGREYFEE